MSTPREIIVTSPHPPLFSHDGYCLGVDIKPSSLLLLGLSAPTHWGSHSSSSLTPPHEVRFSPLPRTCSTPRLSFCTDRKLLTSFTVGVGVGLSVEVGLGLLGLYLLWGKPRLVTSRSRPALVVIPKSLPIAHLAVVAS